jgi:tetratricopeptide (TPR) repeat protein
LSDAREQTKRSAKLLTNDDDIGALRSAESAAEILEAGAASMSRDVEWQLDRLGAYDRIAQVAVKLDNMPRASAALSKDLDIAEKLEKDDPSDVRWQQSLATMHEKLGDLGLITSRFAEAESHFRTALELRTEIAGMFGGSAEAQRDQAIARRKFGDLAMAQRRPEQAIQPYRESVKILESLISSTPSNKDFQHDLSVSYQHLADTTIAAGCRAVRSGYPRVPSSNCGRRLARRGRRSKSGEPGFRRRADFARQARAI